MIKVLKQDTSIYKKQVTRNQMSKLSLGVYFPSDLYAYFLVTNDPFKKEGTYPGLPLLQTKETANGKLEDRENHLWQGKEKQNWRRQCDKCMQREPDYTSPHDAKQLPELP